MCIEDVMVIVIAVVMFQAEPDHDVASVFCTKSFNNVSKESDICILLSISPGLYRFIVYFCQL